ncbi:right-handed parallel beta-helix repeat-containing protein [Myxococcota bacterium]
MQLVSLGPYSFPSGWDPAAACTKLSEMFLAMAIHNQTLNLRFFLLIAALVSAGCGGEGDPATAKQNPEPSGQVSRTAQLNLGSELHVMPGSDATQADGSEKHPFVSVYDAIAAIEGSDGWKGAIIMHPDQHDLKEEVTLPATANLRILAGTVLALGPDVAFHARRDVKVLGTQDAPVTFTWLESGQRWSSFTVFEPSSQENVFEYAIFEHGYEVDFEGVGLRGALAIYRAGARISHCTFRDNEGDDGLTLKESDSLVEYSTFLNHASDAIDEGGSKSEIAFNRFENTGNDALDLGDGSQAYVHDNVILASGDKGISIGETSSPRVERNLIVGCGIGIGNKDGSTPEIRNNTLYANDVGFSSGEAIAGLGSGKGVFTGGIIWGSLTADLSLAEDSETVFSYSCIQSIADEEGNPLIQAGKGIISSGAGCDEPLFADPENEDFHLRSAVGRWDPASSEWVKDETTSPCIDAGDPAADVGEEEEPNGSRINLGCHGGTAEASQSA